MNQISMPVNFFDLAEQVNCTTTRVTRDAIEMLDPAPGGNSLPRLVFSRKTGECRSGHQAYIRRSVLHLFERYYLEKMIEEHKHYIESHHKEIAEKQSAIIWRENQLAAAEKNLAAMPKTVADNPHKTCGVKLSIIDGIGR